MRYSVIVLFAAASISASAQEINKSEPSDHFMLNAGFGLASGIHRIDNLDWSVITPQLTGPRQEFAFTWPSFSLEGRYALNKRVQLSIHYSHWQQEQWIREGHDVVASHWNSVNSYMAGASVEWLPESQLWDLYSGFMAGAAFRHFASRGIEADELPLGDTTLFTYQATVAGVRFGKAVGFVAELGYGVKGIFSTGLSVRF